MVTQEGGIYGKCKSISIYVDALHGGSGNGSSVKACAFCSAGEPAERAEELSTEHCNRTKEERARRKRYGGACQLGNANVSSDGGRGR